VWEWALEIATGRNRVEQFRTEKEFRLFARMYEQLPKKALRPYYEVREELAQWKAEIPEDYRLARQLMDGVRFEIATQAEHEAWMDVARLAIVLELYRYRHGTYPATLDEIAPDLEGGLPLDPFSGQNYSYRPADDDFVVSSMGEDLVIDCPGLTRGPATINIRIALGKGPGLRRK
jgi:hypothetical protein